MASWWVSKVRQTRAHIAAHVTDSERRDLAAWLTPAQMRLFDEMHPADQRHGLDVVVYLERHGAGADPELLLAGLFHDAAKGREVGLRYRIEWSLAEHYGPRVRRPLLGLPGTAEAFDRLDRHAVLSADLAREAGCGERTLELIRAQAASCDDPQVSALRRADEAC